MEDSSLKAMNRTGNARQVRNAGFIPGVLHESDTTSTAIQFEAGPLIRAIAQHGSSAKLRIDLAGKKSVGFIKEVQRHPVEGKILHVVIQLVKQNESVKLQLPIAFHGREDLEHRQLLLTVVKSDAHVSGKPGDMPNLLTVDVTGLEVDATITPANLGLPKKIQLLDPDNEIYAVIKPSRRVTEPEPEAETAAQPAAAETANA